LTISKFEIIHSLHDSYNLSHLQTNAHIMITKCKGNDQPKTGHEGPEGG